MAMTKKDDHQKQKTPMGSNGSSHVSKAVGHVKNIATSAAHAVGNQVSKAVSHVKEHGGEYASKAAHATGNAIAHVAKDAGNAVGHVAVRAGREAVVVGKMFNPLNDPNKKLKRDMTQGVTRAHDPDR